MTIPALLAQLARLFTGGDPMDLAAVLRQLALALEVDGELTFDVPLPPLEAGQGLAIRILRHGRIIAELLNYEDPIPLRPTRED